VAAPHASPLSTAIYYLPDARLVLGDTPLPGDEVFHFYLGDPWRCSSCGRTARPRASRSGRTSRAACTRRWSSPAHVAGDAPAARGEFALLGTTMAPGFDARGFELGDRAALLGRHPGHADLIRPYPRTPRRAALRTSWNTNDWATRPHVSRICLGCMSYGDPDATLPGGRCAGSGR